MMSKKIAAIIVISIAVIAILIWGLNDSSSDTIKVNSADQDYMDISEKISEANTYVIEQDLDDSCFPYRYSHRGCSYSSSKSYLVASSLKDYTLSKDETSKLCLEFAHKGAVAYCLKSNEMKQECLNFANGSSYLTAICNLKLEEIMPSEKFGPYPTDQYEHKGNFSIIFEPVKYSDLS